MTGARSALVAGNATSRPSPGGKENDGGHGQRSGDKRAATSGGTEPPPTDAHRSRVAGGATKRPAETTTLAATKVTHPGRERKRKDPPQGGFPERPWLHGQLAPGLRQEDHPSRPKDEPRLVKGNLPTLRRRGQDPPPAPGKAPSTPQGQGAKRPDAASRTPAIGAPGAHS